MWVRFPLWVPENDKFRQKLVIFSYIRLVASDIAFGSFRGEYNITETVDFNITLHEVQNITKSCVR